MANKGVIVGFKVSSSRNAYTRDDGKILGKMVVDTWTSPGLPVHTGCRKKRPCLNLCKSTSGDPNHPVQFGDSIRFAKYASVTFTISGIADITATKTGIVGGATRTTTLTTFNFANANGSFVVPITETSLCTTCFTAYRVVFPVYWTWYTTSAFGGPTYNDTCYGNIIVSFSTANAFSTTLGIACAPARMLIVQNLGLSSAGTGLVYNQLQPSVWPCEEAAWVARGYAATDTTRQNLGASTTGANCSTNPHHPIFRDAAVGGDPYGSMTTGFSYA